ncbi:MAG TPA: class II aldolase/adducin family protein, partial [Steroidobacteraceae bacterium]|nr:class II aldolase/adducin family protein [Steroidobacteraceae bacterium]
MSKRAFESREAIVAVAQALDDAGHMPNKSGNVSCRSAGGMLITPSGVPYRELAPQLLVELGLDGTVVAGAAGLRPSSEWPMHAAVYAHRREFSAIIHTHSPCATALACAHRGIPAFHYMIALAGGEIRCMPDATFGTAELAERAVQGLEQRRATLLANHGVVAAGRSLSEAHSVAL